MRNACVTVQHCDVIHRYYRLIWAVLKIYKLLHVSTVWRSFKVRPEREGCWERDCFLLCTLRGVQIKRVKYNVEKRDKVLGDTAQQSRSRILSWHSFLFSTFLLFLPICQKITLFTILPSLEFIPVFWLIWAIRFTMLLLK